MYHEHIKNQWIVHEIKVCVLLIFLAITPAPSFGALLDLSDSPLFLGANVQPNVFFEVDDSGSMDWSIMTPVHWHMCSYDPNADGNFSSANCGYEVTTGLIRAYANGSWRDITYMYENNDNDYSDSCNSSSTNSVSSCGTASI